MNPTPQEEPIDQVSRWHVSRNAWLLYAAAVLVGSISTTIPLAIWISPILILLFIDRMPRLIGFLLFFGFVVTVFVITQKGMIPIPDTEFYVMAVIIGILGFVPYWLQVAMKERLPGFLVPLVLPCATVAIEYAASAGSFGSWGSLAYSQAGNLPLMQLASITGIWGITFFMCWTASTVWWVISSVKISQFKLSAEAIVYLAFAIAIIAFGQHRIARGKTMLSQPNDGRQVACIVAPKGPYTPEVVRRWLEAARAELSAQNDTQSAETHSELTRSMLADSRPAVFAELDYLLRKSAERAKAGAKLIVWSEAALSTPPDFEQEILDRCSEFAKSHSTNLAMTLGVIRPDSDPGKFIENKIVFLNEEGSIEGEYMKFNTVPGEPSLNGNGLVPSFDTKLAGRISPIVCFDADFPSFVSQVGQGKIDTATPQTIVISANDWAEVWEQHMQMSAFRAIENGMWVVRSTSRGTSAVISPLGEVQERLSSFESPEPTMSGWVSGGRMRTWYPTVGDAAAQGSCVGLILMIITAIFRGRRNHRR
jgi:apolipoprotein N-acyltransferase